MSVPVLTIYNQHPAACGTPPVFDDESADLYIGYFANRYGEQRIFTLDSRDGRGGRSEAGTWTGGARTPSMTDGSTG